MNAQSQADNEFLSSLLEKEEQKNEEISRAALVHVLNNENYWTFHPLGINLL